MSYLRILSCFNTLYESLIEEGQLQSVEPTIVQLRKSLRFRILKTLLIVFNIFCTVSAIAIFIMTIFANIRGISTSVNFFNYFLLLN